MRAQTFVAPTREQLEADLDVFFGQIVHMRVVSVSYCVTSAIGGWSYHALATYGPEE